MLTNFIYFYSGSPVPNGSDNECDVKLFDLAKSVHWIVDDHHGQDGLKRKMLPGDDSDDETTAPRPPPAQDIYRLRQQKRFK